MKLFKKRILAKNKAGQEYLEADYPNHENDINSMIIFEDSPELKLYSSAKTMRMFIRSCHINLIC